MSTVVDVAEAIVAALAAGSFSQDFTPELEFVPEKEREELSSVRVSVTPISLEVTNLTRGQSQYEIRTDIGVQKHVESGDYDAEVKALLDLTEEVVLALRALDIRESVAGARWLRIENAPVYWHEGLRNGRDFTSIISTFYRAAKP